MAVDSRNKRFSIMGLALVAVSVLPNPDGAIDTAAERQQYTHLYSGITALTFPEVGITASTGLTPRRHSHILTPLRQTTALTPRRGTERIAE